MKYGGYRSQFAFTLARLTKSKLFRGCVAFFILSIFYLGLFADGDDDNRFEVVGGFVGAFSSMLVITGYYLHGKSAFKYRTLYWRAICDLGVALRFILNSPYSYYICNASNCTRATATSEQEAKCWLPSGHLQFFVLASEAWFFCNGLDLYVTVNNPFSSVRSRLWKYHVFVWSFALLVTTLPWYIGQSQAIYGFWYIDSNIDDTAICWLKITSENDLGLPIWFLFFVPLMSMYIFCFIMVFIVYYRLRRGLSQSFQPRIRILVTSITNIIVLILFWMIALLMYGITWQLAQSSLHTDRNSAQYTFDILNFLIASKGFSSLVVWINLTDYSRTVSKKGDDSSSIQDDTLDHNAALREEVLSFVTAGIRSTARAEATRETGSFTRRPKVATMKENDKITPWFFFKLMLGLADDEHLKEVVTTEIRTMKGEMDEVIPPPPPPPRSSLSGASSQQRLSSLNPLLAMTANPSSSNNPMRDSISASNVVQSSLQSTSNNGNGGDLRPSLSMRSSSMKKRVSLEIAPGTTVAAGAAEGGTATDDIGITDDDEEIQPSPKEKNSTISEIMDGHGFKSMPESERKSTVGRVVDFFTRPFTTFFVGKNDIVEFEELKPYFFQQVRMAYNVSDQLYYDEFSKSIKQRLTEGGASGAFFFFSKSDKFVAKSCTYNDIETLIIHAEAYSEYMCRHRNTFLCKIFGAYQLRIYNTKLYFFVMNNLFLNSDNLTINEKYDLKGSWVARNSAPPRDGQTFTCSYCEQNFVYRSKRKSALQKQEKLWKKKGRSQTSTSIDSVEERKASSSSNSANSSIKFLTELRFFSSNRSNNNSTPSTDQPMDDNTDIESNETEGLLDKCPVTVGEHFPNVIMKDNDIKHKIRLTENESLEVQSQIRQDAEFLASLGIMDYSLLVGVHNTEYEVSSGGMFVDINTVNNNDSSSLMMMRSSPTRMMPQLLRRTSMLSSSAENLYSSAAVNNNTAAAMSSALLSAGRGSADSVKSNDEHGNTPPMTPTMATGSLSISSNHQNSIIHESNETLLLSEKKSDCFDTNSDATTSMTMTRKLEVHRIIGPDAYFMGIIDFQQRWDMWKELERFVKVNFKNADPKGLSALEPKGYKDRFLRKIEDVLDHESSARQPSSVPIKNRSQDKLL